jgi:hypothetical protein
MCCRAWVCSSAQSARRSKIRYTLHRRKLPRPLCWLGRCASFAAYCAMDRPPCRFVRGVERVVTGFDGGAAAAMSPHDLALVKISLHFFPDS